MLSSFPRIATFVATLVVSLGVSACSSSPVPVGTNTGNLDNGPSSSGGGSQSSGSQAGGSQASGSQGPCASAAVPTIGCPSGPVVQTCDTSTTPPSWQITCSGGSAGQSTPSMPSNPCGDLPVALPSCASGEPTYICDGAGTAPSWTSACHGTNGVPIGDAGSSRPSSPASDSGTTACEALPVDTIGCPSGEPIYTCVVDSGAPHWSIGCP